MPPGYQDGDDTYRLPERRGSSIMLNGIAAKALAGLASLMLPLGLAGIWWVIEGNTAVRLQLVQMTAEVSALRAEINNIRSDMNTRTDDRYRASDAGRDFRLRDAKDAELERRLSTLENRKEKRE